MKRVRCACRIWKKSSLAEDYLAEKMEAHDSVGGMIECVISGMPAGIGEPVFGKLDAMLSAAIFSIGAVKGVEIGAGFAVADKCGSENNDGFYMGADGKVKKHTNFAGGILGGMSDGMILYPRRIQANAFDFSSRRKP